MNTTPISFKELVTLDGGTEFTFDVPRHHCVAVVGDEHSGVDDLCGIALGLGTGISGTVEIEDQDLSLLSRSNALAFRRKLGYLPAGDGLMQNLSLSNNVALPLKFGSDYSDRAIHGRVKIILAALRIAESADLRPSTVRDEHRRRAAIARSLAFDPEVLLLEAPFDGMTDRVATELLEIVLGGEHAEGSRRTVLFTAQNLSAALRPRIHKIYRAAKGSLTVER
jgi:phospholipid/cholesterol/gamma-HCH transport system ATP-binding protein